MKIAVCPKTVGETPFEIAKNVGEALLKLGAEVLVPAEIPQMDSIGFTAVSENDIFKLCDIAVAIGGDGTIIHVAKAASRFGKPTLGINAGRIGYLAGLEPNELDSLSKLISGDYSVSRRMLLKAEVDDKEFYCLNDAVITRGSLSRMVDISVDINGSRMDTRADGVIIATPTGSTAYSMSAGGPVLDPLVEGIVLSYICPQSPGSRSVVLNKDSMLSVSAVGAGDTEIYLTTDGEAAYRLENNSSVKISCDKEHSVQLINIKSEAFWHVLAKKIK